MTPPSKKCLSFLLFLFAVSRQPPQTVRVRLRHPQQLPIRSVTVNGQDWKGFNPDQEVIELAGLTGTVAVVANYGESR
jgi:hypothetical protein